MWKIDNRKKSFVQEEKHETFDRISLSTCPIYLCTVAHVPKKVQTVLLRNKY